MQAIPEFVKNHFGAKYDANWEKIFTTIYQETPQWGCGQEDSLKFFCWHSEKEINDIVSVNKHFKTNFSEILELLSICQKGVVKNIHDFDDLFLTIEFMKYNYSRQNDLLDFANSHQTDLKSSENFLKKVALEDRQMLFKINQAWSNGRRCRPSTTDNDLMWSFNLASGYSKHLSENLDEFLNILKESNK